jgi:hypothetical protein
MIPNTPDRVPAHTPPEYNQRIRRSTQANVMRYARQGRQAIDRRLAELDREWDIERLLEANASTLVVVGCALGAFVSRKFFVLPALVGGFLLQHAIQGWCPPVPVFRRLGVRTQREIDEERFALKALRGDFEQIQHEPATMRLDSQQAMMAARR